MHGLPVNIWKCQFLTYEVNLLGFALVLDKLQLGKKSVMKLFKTSLPRTLKELMRMLGMLNFCAPFVPDFKRIVAPLFRVLGKQ